MTKGLYTKLDEMKKFIDNFFTAQGNEHYLTRQMINDRSASYIAKFDKLSKTVESQQRTIELLTGALQEKYKDGLFILSDEYKPLVIIKNGQNIINNRTTYCMVSWSPNSNATIEIEEEV